MSNLQRRDFVKFLMSSPLAFGVPQILASTKTGNLGLEREIIQRAQDAIDIFDFDAVAAERLSEAHYTYLSMGVQHEVTLRANRSTFDNIQLRPRRLVGSVRELDLSTNILGTDLSSPIILSPVGAQAAFHPEGELATARAARHQDHLQILSTASSKSLEEVAGARGDPLWFQLYTLDVWQVTRLQIEQAEDAGCPTLVLTVDIMGLPFGENRDRIRRFQREQNPSCQVCHEPSAIESLVGGVIQAGDGVGLDFSRKFGNLFLLDWDYVDRIRDATRMNLVIKGIMTREDARLAIEHGVDGIIVSNHGGRGTDTGLSTIEVLSEIVEEVAGRIPVIVDSGFRRGTDFFKALALGADAVCVGRPYVWGLASFGQEGVEVALDLLRRELEATMRGMGTQNLQSITKDFVTQRS